tara:strand:+ start:1174 stop:1467 length:294 start_codon:yes stop_codon:yes gene_type:complete
MKAGQLTSVRPYILVPEDEYWRGVRSKRGWNMIRPNINETWEVITFDDGNGRMSRVPNSWLIYGSLKDQVAIINTMNPNTRIPTISMCKLRQKKSSL